MIRFALAILAVVLFAGCTQSDTRSEQQAVTTTEHHIVGSVTIPVTGADNLVHPVPVPIDVAWSTKSTTDTSGQSQTKMGLDPAVLGQLIGAMKSAFPQLGVVGAIMSAGGQAAGWNTEVVGSLAAGATGLVAAGGALLKARFHQQDAAKSKADADAAYERLLRKAETSPAVKPEA